MGDQNARHRTFDYSEITLDGRKVYDNCAHHTLPTSYYNRYTYKRISTQQRQSMTEATWELVENNDNRRLNVIWTGTRGDPTKRIICNVCHRANVIFDLVEMRIKKLDKKMPVMDIWNYIMSHGSENIETSSISDLVDEIVKEILLKQ
jgi:hypothetical protein